MERTSAARYASQTILRGRGLPPADAWLRLGIFCLVVGPLVLYGGVTPGAVAGMELGAVAIATVLAIRVARQRAVPVEALALSAPLALLLALGVAQLLPLPESLRAILGVAPEQALRVPLVAHAAFSLNAESTVQALLILASVTVLFFVSLIAIQPRSAVSMATALVAAGGAIAAASLWSFADSGAVFRDVAEMAAGRAHGPFVNPDHFAYWLAALLPLGVAGVLTKPGDASASTRGYRLASAASLPFLAAALGLTFSRGGLIAALGGLLYFTFAMTDRKRRRLEGAAIAATALLGYALWAGGSGLARRFLALWRDPLADLRYSFWEAGAHAFAQAPLLGSGLGTFLEAARRFVGPVVPSRLVVDYAHNEPLQLAVEMGLVGVVIAAWGLVWWFREVQAARRCATSPCGVIISRGAEAGVVALLAGSLVDFAVRLPAVAALAAVLAALAVTSARGLEARRYIRATSSLILVCATAAMMAMAVVQIIPVYQASAIDQVHVPPLGSSDWRSSSAAIDEAIDLRPQAGAYPYLLARLLGDAGFRAWHRGLDLSGEPLAGPEQRARVTQALYARAANTYLAAITADRTNAAYRRDLAWVFANLASLEDNFSQVPFTPEVLLDQIPPGLEPADLAYSLYRDAIDLEPRDAQLHYALGHWALEQLGSRTGQGLGLADRPAAPLEDIATRALRRAIALDPRLLPRVVTEAIRQGADYEDLLAFMPSDRLALWQLAVALEADHRPDWADRLVDVLVGEDSDGRDTVVVETVAARVAQRPDATSARRVLQRLADYAPASARVTGILSRIEWQLGDYGGARKGFRRAIGMLPPSNERTRFEHELGILLIEHGDLAAAKGYFGKLLNERMYDPWVHLGYGMVLDRENAWVDATREYDQARALAGADDDLLYQLGRQYDRRDLDHQAASIWRAALKANPNSAQLHLALARVAAKSSEPAEAIRHYREVLRLRPDDSAARNELHALLVKDAG